MNRINQLKSIFFKVGNLRKKIFPYKIKSKNIDFSLLRISPVETAVVSKEQFIPLARTTIIRQICQNRYYVSGSEQLLFDEFVGFLDTSIGTRNRALMRDILTSYSRLDPDVSESVDDNNKDSFLDEEHRCIRVLSRLLGIANFSEANREQLERWLAAHSRGRAGTVRVSIDPNRYELIKLWVLSKKYQGRSTGSNHFDYRSIWRSVKERFEVLFGNPYRTGDRYRRVVVATREKTQNKIEMKMFRDLSEGEFVHALPHVNIERSRLENTIVWWSTGLFGVGVVSKMLLPVSTIEAGWLLSSSHHLASTLVTLSAIVGFLNWHVIQHKRCQYWQWRSQLNHRSIMASNKGVINILGDRVHDELFKESLLSYFNILVHPNGITQNQLELNIKNWAQEHCNPEFKEMMLNFEVDLTEALSLLQQLNIVTMDSLTQLLTAKSLETATKILGAEFGANNFLQELDGHIIIRNDVMDQFISEQANEEREKTRG